MVKCARRSDGKGLYFLFACVFLIYLFITITFYVKKKGSRRGSKKGSRRGVQKGGSTFCLHPLTCLMVEHRKLNWEKKTQDGP